MYVGLWLVHIGFTGFGIVDRVDDFKDIDRIENVQPLATAVQLDFSIVAKINISKIADTKNIEKEHGAVKRDIEDVRSIDKQKIMMAKVAFAGFA